MASDDDDDDDDDDDKDLLVHLFIFVVPEVYIWPLGKKNSVQTLDRGKTVTTESVVLQEDSLTLRMVAISNQFHSRLCLWLRM